MKKKIKKILIINSGKGGNLRKIFPLLKKENFKIFSFVYNSENLFRFCIKKNIEVLHVKKTSKKNLNKLLFDYANLVKPSIILLFYDHIIKNN